MFNFSLSNGLNKLKSDFIKFKCWIGLWNKTIAPQEAIIGSHLSVITHSPQFSMTQSIHQQSTPPFEVNNLLSPHFVIAIPIKTQPSSSPLDNKSQAIPCFSILVVLSRIPLLHTPFKHNNPSPWRGRCEKSKP